MTDIYSEYFKTSFLELTKVLPDSITLLPLSGSDRRYYRIKSHHKSVIGVINEDVKENKAFVTFTKSFHQLGLPVPAIFSETKDGKSYLQEDLGDMTLFNYLKEKRTEKIFPKSVIEKYKQVLNWLPRFQIEGSKHVPFENCYPRAAFDKQSMMWDLNYFKYYFLKLSGVSFDEQLLENDFETFTNYLLTAPSDFFMYRDFQSRNVMIKDDEVFFIDYQGGRRGSLQYDVASLLYDAKANIPEEIRHELLDYYLDQLSQHIKINPKEFKQLFYGFVIIRVLQAMGAYGYRGFYERKAHFLQSIPYALKNLQTVLKKCDLPDSMQHLPQLLTDLNKAPGLKKFTKSFSAKIPLTVRLNSFSYKKGLPIDDSGNGGGYIFDCRGIHNPGRYEQYKYLTGRDQDVIDFLKKDGEADIFLQSVVQLTEQSIDKYLDRGFTNLQINFGCTGGQHRSVYCAEQLAAHLKDKYEKNIVIILSHREQEIKEVL